MEAWMSVVYRLFPDSARARGEAPEARERSAGLAGLVERLVPGLQLRRPRRDP